jgi:hypothetical protein
MDLPGCDLDVIWDEPTGSEVSTTLMLEYGPIVLLYLPQTDADLDIVLPIVAGFASGMATCFTQVYLFIIVIYAFPSWINASTLQASSRPDKSPDADC